MARPFDHLQPRVTRLGPLPAEAKREVLFIHGAWHGAWCWDELAQGVAAAGYGVSLLEQPGHGQDRWELPGATSINDYARLAARAAGNLSGPVLVGHSLGGWQVQKIWEVADLPGVLLAPLPAGGLPLTSFLKMLVNFPLDLTKPMIGRPVAIRNAAMARRLFLDQAPEEQVSALLARLVPEPARACLEMALGLARARPGTGQQPRLLIAAGRDYFFPVGCEQALARRLGARLEVLPRAPHNLWMEDPEGRVLQLILDFLGSLD
ncbi:MAG: alpha/beta hydrolase [Desulfarculus sp.]|nr:MAG: alpha/beta hydrolase [Desulfarculus sp.]